MQNGLLSKVTVTASNELLVGLEPPEVISAQRYALLVFCEQDTQLKPLTAHAPIVLGREPPAEVVVDDPSISRQHARFMLRSGEVWVEDLDSRNGTFVAERRIREQRLAPGDEVSVGRARVVLAATRPSADSVSGAEAADKGPVIQNAAMKQLYEQVRRAGQANAPVLILGETGSGKELVAAALHQHGPRREKPFVVVNCGAIPAGLVESTLFGHERGAFTGAINRALGVFERAAGGVLFLDEIGELAAPAQAALLRAIETRRISRVGGTAEVAVDVNIVAATHCDLAAMVEEGAFRQDLYFRLSGIVLEVPPLRERPDEIEPLVRFFLQKARAEWGVSARDVAPDALRALSGYAWPGNVRQLQHAVERAALLGTGDTIVASALPAYIFQNAAAAARAQVSFEAPGVDLALRQQLRRYERALIEEALRRAAGNRQVAAKLLRIPVRTVFRRMRACGILSDKEL
ncbi:MAG TPA: sigma 54-interacting transcriptional regulator [Polyangiaceae bacterium]|nr:sigma 54-interacting transcriptional regulator [Polyangiaceae bacterium]